MFFIFIVSKLQGICHDYTSKNLSPLPTQREREERRGAKREKEKEERKERKKRDHVLLHSRTINFHCFVWEPLNKSTNTNRAE